MFSGSCGIRWVSVGSLDFAEFVQDLGDLGGFLTQLQRLVEVFGSWAGAEAQDFLKALSCIWNTGWLVFASVALWRSAHLRRTEVPSHHLAPSPCSTLKLMCIWVEFGFRVQESFAVVCSRVLAECTGAFVCYLPSHFSRAFSCNAAPVLRAASLVFKLNLSGPVPTLLQAAGSEHMASDLGPAAEPVNLVEAAWGCRSTNFP